MLWGYCLFTSTNFVDQYITAYKQSGDSPMLNLLIGICFLHIVCMKFTTQRATLAVQGVCFLDRYLKLRGECQESFYNLGREISWPTLLWHWCLCYVFSQLWTSYFFSQIIFDLGNLLQKSLGRRNTALLMADISGAVLFHLILRVRI